MSLNATEQRLFDFLRAHAGAWFSREELRDRALGEKYAVGTAAAYFSSTRSKLGPDGKHMQSRVVAKGVTMFRWSAEVAT